MLPAPELLVFVYTGDRKCAGTNNTVHIIIHGKDGKCSKAITLNNFFSNDFERGQVDNFKVSTDDVEDLGRFVEVERLEVWKDKILDFISDDWFVDKIKVENKSSNKTFVFPFFRWIKSGQHYHIKQFDTSLPQFDEYLDQRKRELEEKKRNYQYAQKIPNGPVQVKSLPPDENFSFAYQWDIATTKISLQALGKIKTLINDNFRHLDDIAEIYDDKVFKKPRGAHGWDSDAAFGRKRMNSINPVLIRRLTEIPDKFPITNELLEPLLEGMTIEHAMHDNKLFYVDLNILEGISIKPEFVLCTPFLLLFVDKEKQLRPIAIQLFQEPGPENPIFTPLDDPKTWNYVKMWYDNADSAYHQALTHLGLTHLLMEGVALSTQRNLSPTHPVFKILAPHFLYVIAINSRALEALVSPGGWIDKSMAYGAKGLMELCAKGIDNWRMNVEGLLPQGLKSRGLDDPGVLPGYYYRDDGMLLFDAIHKYAAKYIDLYYNSDDVLKEDEEIQAWVQELDKERNQSEGGVGIKGVPGNGVLTSKQQLVDVITSTIFTCSVAHASANFGQYDEYAYPPNYPTVLKGKPPTSKDVKLTDQDILHSLADVTITQDILTVTTILSRKGTNSLGDFEVTYIFDPNALKIVDEFREDLSEISKKIKARNEQVEFPYDDLLPEDIPNSISI